MFVHHLKLFPNTTTNPNGINNGEGGTLESPGPEIDVEVVEERYDEIIIRDPSPALRQLYDQARTMTEEFPSNSGQPSVACSQGMFSKQTEQKQLMSILGALNRVRDDISSHRERARQLSGQINALKKSGAVSASSSSVVVQSGNGSVDDLSRAVGVSPAVENEDDTRSAESVQKETGDNEDNLDGEDDQTTLHENGSSEHDDIDNNSVSGQSLTGSVQGTVGNQAAGSRKSGGRQSLGRNRKRVKKA